MSNDRTRSFWGWGWQGQRPGIEHQRNIAGMLAARFDCAVDEPRPEPTLADIVLPACRLAPPAALADIVCDDPAERAGHTYGKSFRDIVRGFSGDFSVAPDLVALPRDEADVIRILDWAGDAGIAAIPYGGGSSVVGGVEAAFPRDYAGAVSIDLRGLDRILEIDRTSRAARIQAGIYGPALENGLRPHGLTLRHYPQSFEFSTLGGWIATRSGGHYATLYTHIDDFVESLRTVTPTGVMESRRLPGSGAGPSPDRLVIGSEGILGIITEAWMRLQDRPVWRASASVRFEDFYRAAECVRTISQAGLFPANLRLIDKDEALTTGAGDGMSHLLIVGFESADHDPGARMQRTLEVCRDHGGVVADGAGASRRSDDAARQGAAGAWRDAFLRAPYLRDALVGIGFLSETFETAVTWDRFEAFHRGLTERMSQGLARICGGGGITCRFTHVYPDGPAPYYTVLAPSRHGSQLGQWNELKAMAMEAIAELGGTVTHHHAVGRDHRPGYDRQRPDVFARALVAAKRELDPAGVLNPGVLVDPA
jgi:alkyldihydroxyacetonephosphate synthase